MSDQVTTEESPTTENWGPYHRHFASDAIHRDDGPECNEPGTPKRVYEFDPDYLEEHDQWIRDHALDDQIKQKLQERLMAVNYGIDRLGELGETVGATTTTGQALTRAARDESDFLTALIGDM